MIISHKHRFIFLHTPKTGGSSISVSLLRYLGGKDVITSGIADAYSAGVLPPIGVIARCIEPRSLSAFTGMIVARHSLGEALSAGMKTHYAGRGLGDHTAWRGVKSCVGEEVWNTYYKFAFERNPWDKMVSEFFWEKQKDPSRKVSFKEFLRAYVDGYNQFTLEPLREEDCNPHLIYADKNNAIQVDAVGRYEKLAEDLGTFLSESGIEWDGWLPRAKGNFRPRHPYRDFYDAETQELVRKTFSWVIEHFGYEF